MSKDLQDKAIDFKGQQYVLVKDRIIYFNEQYPSGSIETELLSEPDADRVVIKATVRPNDKQCFTGLSQALWGEGFVNKTSAIENAETSAVGRALAFMGIGVIDAVASIDEINKAKTQEPLADELSKAKQEIQALFKEKGYTSADQMIAFIKEATGKESISSVAVAKVILRKLSEKE